MVRRRASGQHKTVGRAKTDPTCRNTRGSRAKLKRHDTIWTTDHERTQHSPTKLGSSGAECAIRALKRALRLCRSSRPPSGAGRSPYHSEPSIDAPDSTTTSRRIGGETPAITHHPTHEAIPGRAPRPASEAAGEPPAPTVPRPAGAQRAGGNGVGGGRWWCRRARPPTQVTGRNPLLLRFRSRVSPAITRVSHSRGVLAAPHLNRSWALRRQLRSRS
jgi:hypothetical protein